MIIHEFCQSCDPEVCQQKWPKDVKFRCCEFGITIVVNKSPGLTLVLPMLYHCEKTTTVKFFGHRSYKTCESTLYCIGNSEENMDLSVIYLAVNGVNYSA